MKRSGKTADPESRQSAEKKPRQQGGSKGSRIHRRKDAALGLLLEGFEFSEELHCSIWYFAVEIEELRKAGFTNSNLRWLAYKGYVEHAREIRPTDEHSRSFRPTGHLSFHESTCFVLTETGVDFSRKGLRHATHGSKAHHVPEPPSNGEKTADPAPKWDPDRLELRVFPFPIERLDALTVHFGLDLKTPGLCLGLQHRPVDRDAHHPLAERCVR